MFGPQPHTSYNALHCLPKHTSVQCTSPRSPDYSSSATATCGIRAQQAATETCHQAPGATMAGGERGPQAPAIVKRCVGTLRPDAAHTHTWCQCRGAGLDRCHKFVQGPQVALCTCHALAAGRHPPGHTVHECFSEWRRPPQGSGPCTCSALTLRCCTPQPRHVPHGSWRTLLVMQGRSSRLQTVT